MNTEFDTLYDRFASGPDELASMIQGLTEQQMDAVPIEGRWSIRQVVAHLADFEIINCERMKRIIAEDNPSFFDADPNLFERALQYGHRSVTDELNLIRHIRKHLLSILRASDVEVLQRTGVHSSDGPMTLETLIERTTKHIGHHLKFIQEKINALTIR